MFDLILKGGNVIDGTGTGSFVADIAVTGDRISAIGSIDAERGAEIIDVTGLAVAPGFIDMHTHSDFTILVEGDKQLFNQYGIIRVDPTRCPLAKAGAGQRFVDWMLSDRGQQAIAAYRLNGQQLFFPNAE